MKTNSAGAANRKVGVRSFTPRGDVGADQLKRDIDRGYAYFWAVRNNASRSLKVVSRAQIPHQATT